MEHQPSVGIRLISHGTARASTIEPPVLTLSLRNAACMGRLGKASPGGRHCLSHSATSFWIFEVQAVMTGPVISLFLTPYVISLSEVPLSFRGLVSDVVASVQQFVFRV